MYPRAGEAAAGLAPGVAPDETRRPEPTREGSSAPASASSADRPPRPTPIQPGAFATATASSSTEAAPKAQAWVGDLPPSEVLNHPEASAVPAAVGHQQGGTWLYPDGTTGEPPNPRVLHELRLPCGHALKGIADGAGGFGGGGKVLVCVKGDRWANADLQPR